ncbi:MAG: hypothetical protein K0U39_10095 [Alphaproteobacteria bacterium]|nr:hypothetical protein [Alphaproteobacteria bacterium]
MKKETESFEPFIDGYCDDEERELIEDIETAAGQAGYVPVSVLTPERKAMYQRAAARALERRGK